MQSVHIMQCFMCKVSLFVVLYMQSVCIIYCFICKCSYYVLLYMHSTCMRGGPRAAPAPPAVAQRPCDGRPCWQRNSSSSAASREDLPLPMRPHTTHSAPAGTCRVMSCSVSSTVGGGGSPVKPRGWGAPGAPRSGSGASASAQSQIPVGTLEPSNPRLSARKRANIIRTFCT